MTRAERQDHFVGIVETDIAAVGKLNEVGCRHPLSADSQPVAKIPLGSTIAWSEYHWFIADRQDCRFEARNR